MASRICLFLIIIISVLVVVLALLSLIHDLSYWYLKVLDFPRLQYLVVGLVCLLLFLLLNKRWKWPSILLSLSLIAAIAIQSIRIFPYVAGRKKVPDAPARAPEEQSARIMISNVLMTNRDAEAFLEIVERVQPDMLLVMEADQWWVDQLQPLKKSYAHHLEHPLDNAYGMALYSRLPMEETQIRFLNEKVPSFHTKVRLLSGEIFRFHGVHPVAPVPSGTYPDNQGNKEVALLKVGELVANDTLPSVVAGDFNDVSWSNTSRLFEDQGDLRNVRLGRGLYNSFNAKSPIMRWPLDHFFVTREFALGELERLPKFGSDHFPLFIELVLINSKFTGISSMFSNPAPKKCKTLYNGPAFQPACLGSRSYTNGADG